MLDVDICTAVFLERLEWLKEHRGDAGNAEVTQRVQIGQETTESV